MMAASGVSHESGHPYHMVNPSPWPVTGAASALVMFGGAVYYMHSDRAFMDAAVFLLGLGLVFFALYGWWRDVVREATFEGRHTAIVQFGLRYGMVLFIFTEVMFFTAWFWAFFDASLFPGGAGAPEMVGRTEVLGGVWPPEGVESFNPFGVPLLNTIILLSSGATVTWAHHALREGDRGRTLLGLALTIGLGLIFTSLQAYEYSEAPFAFDEGIYSSTFFMATGFHGAHVILGTIFLTVCFVRAYLGHFKPDHHFGFEAATWYWHFVDVVWLFLFTFIYWWGGS
jgi:cytochrome c oxidase subunit 3